MKANELMINDWVYQALYKDAEIPNKGHGWKEVRVAYLPFDEDWALGPIPLTKEILKKNGFIYKPLMKRWVIDGELELIEDKMGNVDLEYWFSVSGQYICPIHYVHQLQHAVRLCGLFDLADNFKIK